MNHRSLGFIVCLLTGCVTTTAVEPRSLARVAGVREGDTVGVGTAQGVVSVSGKSLVHVRPHDPAAVAYDVPLAGLRGDRDGNVLLLPDDQWHATDTLDIKVTRSSPGRTAALVGGIVGGGLLLGVAAFITLVALSSFPALGG